MNKNVLNNYLKYFIKSIFLLLICVKIIFASSNDIHLLPPPREMKILPQDFVINEDCLIVLGDKSNEKDIFAVQNFIEELEEVWSWKIKVSTGNIIPSQEFILVGVPLRDSNIADYCEKQKITCPSQLGEEGYILEVNDKRIVLIANHNKGLFYGMQTLKQLIKVKGNNLVIQGVEIEDWPILKYRGIQDDISRGPIANLDYFKRMIKICSEYKINMLMFYIEHMFAYEKHPEISPEGALTKDEVKELLDYAKNYYIELVPQQQSLGHFYHILKHPQYKDLARTPEILDPSKEETYKLLEDMYSEIIPAFDQTENPTQFFHVGCDETFGLDPQLYLAHIKRLHKMISSYGKTMMIWGDMCLKYPEIIPELPKDIIIMNWEYRDLDTYYYQLVPFQEAKLEQFICPGVSCWRTIFPDFTVALRNINNFVWQGLDVNVTGMLTATWDDDGENLFGYNWYGIIYSASCAWNVEDVKDKRFTEDFINDFYKSNNPDLIEAFNLLIKTSDILSNPYNGVFWIEPFSLNTTIDESSFLFPGAPPCIAELDTSRLEEAKKTSTNVIDLIKQSYATVKKNRENLDYIIFAANRYYYLADKNLTNQEIVEKYENLYNNYKKYSKDEVLSELSFIKDILEKKYKELEELKRQYKELWLKENRQYYLDVVLNRYDSLLEAYSKCINQLQQAKIEYEQGENLPDIYKIGLKK